METMDDILREMRIGDVRADDNTTSTVYINDVLSGYADRIEEAAKRDDEMWRAAFAKIKSVVTLQRDKDGLGDIGRIAIDEIMSACCPPEGAIDEYERVFYENARLRASIKTVLDIITDSSTQECNNGYV